MRHLFFYSSL